LPTQLLFDHGDDFLVRVARRACQTGAVRCEPSRSYSRRPHPSRPHPRRGGRGRIQAGGAGISRPAFGAPGILPFVDVDRAFVVENVDGALIFVVSRAHRDKIAAAAQAFGIGVAVLVRDEEVFQRFPETGSAVGVAGVRRVAFGARDQADPVAIDAR